MTEVIVYSGDVDVPLPKRLHNWADFILREDEVPHGHCPPVADREECDPRSERERRLQLDVPDAYMEVGTGQSILVDSAWL